MGNNLVLSKLKYLLNIEDDKEDNKLLTLFDIAGGKILERLYPYDETKTDVPPKYLNRQVEITVYLYNKQGAEGQVTHNELGVNRTYESGDVPDSMFRGIVPFVGVIEL